MNALHHPHRVRAAAIAHARLRARRQRGIGLVELMVAMVIGLFLIAGALSVFMEGRSTSRTADAASNVQAVLRYAMDTVEPDVRLASFWGLTNRPDYVGNAASPADPQSPIDLAVDDNCGTNFTVDLERFVDGRNNGYAGLTCAGVSPAAWTDVLIVRRAASEPTVPVADRIQVQSNRLRGELFMDGTVPPMFAAVPGSVTHDLLVSVYYVGRILPDPATGPQWALRRKSLVADAGGPRIDDVELARGIEDLQVQFGLDTNADDAADVWVNAGAPELAAGGRPVAVRVWLRALADEREAGFVDATDWEYADQDYGVLGGDRRRTLVTKTIQLRNSRALL
jgi:type IV pilus assembly protein PilW